VTYAGLSRLEAIQAATQSGALMLGLHGKVGVIAPGMLADIIVVNGDPTRDPRVLQDKRRVEAVIKDGRRVVFDEQAIARRTNAA
jgi:imidazolonepropionase-like amidohydrolase